MTFKKIDDINTYEGTIPSGFDLVITEENDIENSALTLYGFDEIDDFVGDFKKPIYGFLKL
jgi:hypothetical protein